MNTQYIIIKREQCPECHGRGFIEDTDWRAFWQWRQRGFKDNDRPPGEWSCEDCDGTGVEESEVSLQEALEALGIMSVLKLCGFVQENS